MSVKQPMSLKTVLVVIAGVSLFWAACSERVLSFTSESEGASDAASPPSGSSSTSSGGGEPQGEAGAPPDDTTGGEHGLVNTPG